MLTLNVNDHVEKKQNLSYLSWAWAWAEALKADPAARFDVRMFHNSEGVQQSWMSVHGTAMVFVSVTMFGKEMECFLPVMDHRNKPIPDPDAFQVNTALMRCMTKCLALFGIGLYIYAGEDLPEEAESKPEPKPKKEEKEPEPIKADDLKLFADAMVEASIIAKTARGARSMWKVNQASLDKLKEHMPEEYARVLEVFRERTEQLKEKESE